MEILLISYRSSIDVVHYSLSRHEALVDLAMDCALTQIGRVKVAFVTVRLTLDLGSSYCLKKKEFNLLLVQSLL